MRSEQIKTGVERTPNRSLLYALGYTDEELSRPLIGVVSSYNEIVPGHMGLDKIAEAVKAGIRAAGGTPVMFPAIAVCDGIAMGHVGMKYSLVTRDLIADSTEAMVMAHQFDGLVMIPNCDKNVPGLLMAAARLNIPTIFCSGGPMLAGRPKDGRRTCLSHMFEAVGAYHAGKLDEAGVADYTENACPTCGSCSGMYTANSMNCLTEAIGMALRGNGTIPAVYSARLRLAKQTGMKIMELVEENVRPRDIMTEAAFHNAETVDMALGCSTNTMLHLPAIAHEAGVKLDLRMVNGISDKTPNLCHLAPAGDTYIEDLDRAGGVWAVMKELTKAGLLDTSLPTVTSKTVGENLETASVSGSLSQLREVRLGLRTGKKVTRALVRFEREELAWQSTVKAEDFSLGSFKTPKVEREEDDDPDAAFLEKMYLMELCLGLFDACYKQFLDIRLSSLWNKEVQDMSAWMSQQA